MSIRLCRLGSATVGCASCAARWGADYLSNLFLHDRLLANGFAYVALPDGRLAINYCPSCDRRPTPAYQEISLWTSLAQLF